MATIRNLRSKPAQRTLLVGAAGGVGSAALALLERHALGRRLLEGTKELLLLDRDPPIRGEAARLPDKMHWLPPRAIQSGNDLAELLREHPVDEVIELAALGTWDCIQVCAERNVSYLNTCYDHWDSAGPPIPSMIRARELFEPPDIEAGVHVIGAGMNPGLVNLLVDAGLRALAERTGRAASLAALDIHTIAFTELDTTHEPSEREQADEFAATWCPEHCLEELLEPEAMIVVDGELVGLGHAPHRAKYAARCGDRTSVGHMVPHEELVTLSAMYPGVELGYVYELPERAMRALARRPERRPSEWPIRRLYPPHTAALEGFDRIGVLLCSREYGELWIGWHTDVEDALALGTNATLLQVATGLLAGWSSLRELDPGIWLAEELEGRRVLSLACSVLGELEVVWDREAKPLSLRERRVD